VANKSLLLHVLTPGFTTPNGRAFLFPLIVYRHTLAAAGISMRFFNRAEPGVTDCDCLLVDRKFHEPMWPSQELTILEDMALWSERTRLIFCDTSDSAGWLHSKLLPIVHVYAKGQLLRDRTTYLQSQYGYRAFSDYYHRTMGVTDEPPEWSHPVDDETLLKKLRVSWNSGLADYSPSGPCRMALYGRLPLPPLLHFPDALARPEAERPQPVSCRFGTVYSRASVAFQRQLIRERMAARMPTDKLSRRRYFGELRRSKVVVSPFGWGEITLKDFEVFLTGGLLYKPDMSGIDTWPDLFVGGETCAFHAWDLADFESGLEAILADHAMWLPVAREGQARYLRHLSGQDAPALFVEHLQEVVGV
jgi:hypothetical protein